MTHKEDKNPKERTYPPIYEKLIPILIIALGLIITGILIFTVAVGLGFLNY